MSLRTFVGFLAAAALAVGLYGLLSGVSVDGPERNSLVCDDGGISNAVIVSDRDQADGGELAFSGPGGYLIDRSRRLAEAPGPVYPAAAWEADCARELATRSIWAWPAAIIGGVVLLGAVIVRR